MKGTERPEKILRAIEHAGCTLVRAKNGIKILTPGGTVLITHALHGHKTSEYATVKLIRELRDAGVQL